MSTDNLCTFNVTKKSYKEQFWYYCFTCAPGSYNVGCCLGCAATCHKGHKLKGPNYSSFFCDCGAGELSGNKCLSILETKTRSFNPNKHNGYTFDVHENLEIVTKQMELVGIESVLKQVGKIKLTDVESTSFAQDEKFINGHFTSKFLETIEIAYSNHFPLKLSPSHFLLMISQGLATHINQNAEELRKYLVNYEGKKKLLVSMNDYNYGQPYDWTKIFDTFTELIKTDVNPEIYSVVKDEFSCSTPLTKACADVALMDCMKSFCEYYGSACCCGIKRVTLDGTPDDWKVLRDKVYKLNSLNGSDDKLKLKWWLDALIPVVEKICNAGINHVVDPDFWSRIYNFQSGSGFAFASGWICVFFPYYKNDDKYYNGELYESKKNMELDWENGKCRIDIGNDPANISSVDFTLKYEKEFVAELKFKFNAGFFGTIQYDDLTVEPMLGWIINRNEDKPEKKKNTQEYQENHEDNETYNDYLTDEQLMQYVVNAIGHGPTEIIEDDYEIVEDVKN